MGLDCVRSDEPVETIERTKYVGSPRRTFSDAVRLPLPPPQIHSCKRTCFLRAAQKEHATDGAAHHKPLLSIGRTTWCAGVFQAADHTQRGSRSRTKSSRHLQANRGHDMRMLPERSRSARGHGLSSSAGSHVQDCWRKGDKPSGRVHEFRAVTRHMQPRSAA